MRIEVGMGRFPGEKPGSTGEGEGGQFTANNDGQVGTVATSRYGSTFNRRLSEVTR
jgi:hypothetical protein